VADSSDPDFVQMFLRLVMDAAPSFSEEQARQVEQQIRHDYGGERVIIARRPSLHEERVQVQIEARYKSAKRLHQEHPGVSRQTIYNWLKKNK